MRRFIKVIATLLSAAIIMGSGLFTPSSEVQAEAGVYVNETNFPDSLFRDYISNVYPVDDDYITASDLKLIKELEYDGTELDYKDKIKNFAGIELFTSLESIKITGCGTGTIDISKNKSLKSVQITDCFIDEVIVGDSNSIEEITIDRSDATSISIGKCTSLTYIDIHNTPILEIDVSDCSELERMILDGMPIETLDISRNPKLSVLFVTNNTIMSEICIGNNPLLIKAYENGTVNTNAANTLYMVDEENSLAIAIGMTVNTTPIVVSTPTTTATPTVTTTPVTTNTPTAVPATSAPTKAPSKNVGDFVLRCYEIALDRDADTAGYYYWCDKLLNGQACGAQVGYGFIFSGEYIMRDRPAEYYIMDLYQMFFGRDPDEEGFMYWYSMLENDACTREEIFAGFANSLEFYNLCDEYNVVAGSYVVGVDNDRQGGVNCFVARLYKICLDRLPDMGSQAIFVDKLLNNELSGTEIAYQFIFSPEFMQKELSNKEFVQYMYRAFFGREADEAGLNAWVEELNYGESYDDVFYGFSGSLEFDVLCNSYGINREGVG